MLVVAALGGNALLRRGEAPDPGRERERVALAASALAPIARRHALVVTHGNGPQVGLLALQAAALADAVPTPLDLLGAESAGLIGAVLAVSLKNALPEREVAVLLSLVEVGPADPAFLDPVKAIGPLYDAPTASRLAAEHGWRMRPDGRGYRRAVASPRPRRVHGIAGIRRLVEAGAVVVCAGGGGVPVAADRDGRLVGVEAVIDKDLTAALLAEELGADALLLLTDIGAVELDFGKPGARAIRQVAPDQIEPTSFAPGSMQPKIEAAAAFARVAGRFAAIGALEAAAELLAGRAGTRVERKVALSFYPPPPKAP